VVPDELLSVARICSVPVFSVKTTSTCPAPSIFDSAAAMRASCSLSKNEQAGFRRAAPRFCRAREPVGSKMSTSPIKRTITMNFFF
jgi:hypothetical protein